MMEMVLTGSAGGGSEWQEEYYVRSRQYLTRGVPNNQRWRQHNDSSRIHWAACTLVELQLECFTYLCGILSFIGTWQIYIFHIAYKAVCVSAVLTGLPN